MNSKPTVCKIGTVVEDGNTFHVRGWGLSPCVTECRCHWSPFDFDLHLLEDQERGLLGLQCYSADGCDCCEPWTAEELAAMLRDLAAIEAIEEIEVLEVIEVIKATEEIEEIQIEIEEIEIEGNEGVGS